MGIPMQVIAQREFSALCRGRNGEKAVETLLIGPQAEGTWVLEFLGVAREVLSAEDAERLNNALDALETLMAGAGPTNLEDFFSDLSAPDRPPGGRG